jgi:hypothetical protein
MKKENVTRIQSLIDRIKSPDFDISKSDDYIKEISEICTLPEAIEILRSLRDKAILEQKDQPTRATLNCLTHVIGWTAFPTEVQAHLRRVLYELNKIDDECSVLFRDLMDRGFYQVRSTSTGQKYIEFCPVTDDDAKKVSRAKHLQIRMKKLSDIIVSYDDSLRKLSKPEYGYVFSDHPKISPNLIIPDEDPMEFLSCWISENGKF